jgi:uncharacterized membrane protein
MLTAAITIIKEKVSALIEKLKIAARDPEKMGTYTFLIVMFAMIYGVVFSYFTSLRNDTFYSAAWDLGNFNQAFYNTISGGKMFYYTADTFFSPSGSLFAIHISPILFILLPLYATSPSPVTLLVIKSFGIGLAAIPLYFLARELLESSKAGFLMALVYLLYSPLHGANWFDFQQSAFFALFLFSMYFLMVKKNWKLFFPMMMLTLMVEEHVAVVIAILAIYCFSFNGSIRQLPQSLKRLKMNESLASLLTVAICISYFFVAMLIKNSFPVAPGFAQIYKASGNFRILGSSDTLTLPIYVLLNPQRAFDGLTYDFAYKFFYLVFLFAPLLFIPLRNRFCLGVAFILMPFILSNYRPYYLLGIHYPFYIIPLIFIGATYGIRRLEPHGRLFNLKTMVVVTLLFAIVTSPLSPLSNVFVQQGTANYAPIQFSLDENKKSLNDLLSLVPSNASILTQNMIFPHVSNRLNAYVIPFSEYENPIEMEQYVSHLVNNSEYVLIDMGSIDSMAAMVLNKISKDNTFGTYALGKQSILFKRGFHGEPLYTEYVANRTFVVYRDMQFSTADGSSIIDDPTSSTGKAYIYPKGASGFCIYGPYVYLLQGAYEATFTVKVGDHSAGRLGTFDVSTDIGTRTLSFRDTYGFELRTGEWTNITVPFSLPDLTTQMEFRFFSLGTAEISFDRVILRRTSSASTAKRSMLTLQIGALKLSSGTVNEEGFLIHPTGTTDEVFWFGPYWDFSPGNYTATFLLRVTPVPTNETQTVLTLSVSGKTERASQVILLNERILHGEDFIGTDNASDWQSFKVDFIVEKPMVDIELRGLFPASYNDISLAFIIVERLDLQ